MNKSLIHLERVLEISIIFFEKIGIFGEMLACRYKQGPLMWRYTMWNMGLNMGTARWTRPKYRRSPFLRYCYFQLLFSISNFKSYIVLHLLILNSILILINFVNILCIHKKVILFDDPRIYLLGINLIKKIYMVTVVLKNKHYIS